MPDFALPHSTLSALTRMQLIANKDSLWGLEPHSEHLIHAFDTCSEAQRFKMPFAAPEWLKSPFSWLQTFLSRKMLLPKTMELPSQSDVPTGKHTLPRTRELRESLRSIDARYHLESTNFFGKSDEDAILMFGKAFGRELEHLKNAKASVEASSTTTKGGLEGNLTPSRLLYQKDYSEVNRTLVGVLALKWIVNGDYDKFTGPQKDNPQRLRRPSWDELRRIFESTLQSDGEVYALLVATIVNDLGKDPALVQEICDQEPDGATSPNHDAVIYEAARAGKIEVLQDFKSPDPKSDSPLYNDLITGLHLGKTLNIGQLAQAENVPGSLSIVRTLKPSRHAFALKFLEILLDVAGASGSIDASGSLIFTESLFRSYLHARDAILRLIGDDTIPLRAAYDCVLTERAAMIRAGGFGPVPDPTTGPLDAPGRALLRLLCIARAFDPPDVVRVVKAVNSLPKKVRAKLEAGLNVDGDADGTAILPYYAPALFHNAKRATANNEQKSVRAFAAVMRLLVRMYRGTRPRVGSPGRVVECDLSVAQEATKGAAGDPIGQRFAAKPEVLDELQIPDRQYSEPVGNLG